MVWERVGASTPHGHLIIVCGLPGAGKTTMARQLEAQLDGIRFCPDEWMGALGFDIYDGEARARVEALQWQVAQEVLAIGQTAIIEWGTWGRAEREELRSTAQRLGAFVELLWLDVDPDELWRRVQARGMEQRLGCRPLTRADVDDSVSRFEAPTSEELATYDRATRR